MRKVLFLTRYNRLGASSRVRFYEYLGLIKPEHLSIKVNPFFYDSYVPDFYEKKVSHTSILLCYLRRIWVLINVWHYDTIYLEKELFPKLPFIIEYIFLRYLKLSGTKLLVDIDDAFYLDYRNTSTLIAFKIERVMMFCDEVIAGSKELERYSQNFNEKVRFLPSCITLGGSKLSSCPPSNRLIIGWLGTPYTAKYLSLIEGLVIEHTDVDWFFMGGILDSLAGLPNTHYFEWSVEDEEKFLSKISIGIMPLEDTAFERAKCGYKLLKYMAHGAPVIASKIGANNYIVNETNGILCSNLEEWNAAVIRMKRMDVLLSYDRKSILGYVNENYSHKSQLNNISDLL